MAPSEVDPISDHVSTRRGPRGLKLEEEAKMQGPPGLPQTWGTNSMNLPVNWGNDPNNYGKGWGNIGEWQQHTNWLGQMWLQDVRDSPARDQT